MNGRLPRDWVSELRTRHARDERGSMLVLALVMIMVIGIAGAAVLNQAANAPAAQQTYSAKATTESGSEASIDNVLSMIRTNYPQGSEKSSYDPAAGAFADTVGCDDNSGGSTPSVNSGFDRIGTDSSGNDIYCVPSSGSGQLEGTAPEAPPQSILTLGGMATGTTGLPYPDTNVVNTHAAWSNPSTTPPNKLTSLQGNTANGVLTGSSYASFSPTGASSLGDGAPNPLYYQPFCKDFHDFQDSSHKDVCEASLFIGKAVNDTSSETNTSCAAAVCPGGLLVANTGSFNVTQPLVQTNGSIVVSNVQTNGQQVQRELDVEGSIWARSNCGFGAGGTGFGNPPMDVFAGWSQTGAWLNATTPADSTQKLITAGTVGPYQVTDELHCNNSNGTVGPTGANASVSTTPSSPANASPDESATTLIQDPDYVHEPIDLSYSAIVNASVPMGNAGSDACQNGGLTNAINLKYTGGGSADEIAPNPNTWSPCSSNDCYDMANGKNDSSCQLNLTASSCESGIVVMPAREIQDNNGNAMMQSALVNGVTKQSPVFTAWYDNASDLNSVMNSCPDALIWFRPGVYYFDFQDSSGPVRAGVGAQWLSPKGCWPIQGSCSNPDEMVGGSPGALWAVCHYDSGTGTTNAVDPSTQVYDTTGPGVYNCPQPARNMFPQLAQSLNGTPFDNVPAGVTIDNQSTEGTTCTGANSSCPNGTATLQWGDLQTPIPAQTFDQPASNPPQYQNFSKVNQLDFEIAYNTPGGLADEQAYQANPTSYKATDFSSWYKDMGNDKYANGAGAEVEFQIAGGASCYVHLPNGPHGALDEQTVAGTKITINLKYGCDPAYVNKVTDASTGDGIFVDQVGAGFPCGPTADWTSATTVYHAGTGAYPAPIPGCATTNTDPTTCGCTFQTAPNSVNTLKATFLYGSGPSATGPGASQKALGFVNGSDFVVQWNGRPSPGFPGGCDRTLPGVQFIFGGVAKTAWGSNNSRSMFAELCASKQSTFPANAPGHAFQYRDSFCGTPPCNDFTKGNGSSYGIAMYGMTEDAAGPASTVHTSQLQANTPAPANTTADFKWNSDSSNNGGPLWVNPDGTGYTTGSTTWNVANPTENTNTKQVSAIFNSSNWGTTTFAYNLPSNLIGYGAGQIPPGAFITQVRMEMYHREGNVTFTEKKDAQGNGTGFSTCGWPIISSGTNTSGSGGVNTYYFAHDPGLVVGQVISVGGQLTNGYNILSQSIATTGYDNTAKMYFITVNNSGSVGAWKATTQPAVVVTGPLPKVLPAGCTLDNSTASDGINSVNLKIMPGNTGNGSNEYNASSWTTKGNTHLDGGAGVPYCSDYNAAPTTSGGYTYNAFIEPTVNPANPTQVTQASIAPASEATDYLPGKNTVNPNNGAGAACPFTWGNINSTDIAPDSTGEDWTVQRDLTDAMSTPEGWNGAELLYTVAAAKTTTLKEADYAGTKFVITYRAPSAADSYQPRPISGCATTRTGWPNGYLLNPGMTDASKPSQVATGYDWLDHDWGTQLSTGASPFNTDDAYGNDSAQPGGTGGSGDAQDCSLWQIINGNSLQGVTIKFHAGGMLYAPSGAIDMNSNDNDAAWAADGIVARHLTALRWKNNGTTPAVGDDPAPRSYREFTIYVCKGSAAGNNETKCVGSGNTLAKALVVINDYDEGNFSPGHSVDIVSWNWSQ